MEELLLLLDSQYLVVFVKRTWIFFFFCFCLHILLLAFGESASTEVFNVSVEKEAPGGFMLK